ncbi:MAG: hypothetical protein AB1798_12025, partial [Spirochaetota bacterium]
MVYTVLVKPTSFRHQSNVINASLLIHIFLLFLARVPPLNPQEIDMEAVYSKEEFHWGVQSFHYGLFNKAILSFEKALSYKPQDVQTLEWLGRAYYRSGFDETALGTWNNIIRSGKATALLKNRVEILNERRGLGRELGETEKYVIAGEIRGKEQKLTLFQRPSSVLPQKDGSFYLVSFGSNEILLFETNGTLKQRLRGGFQGFDHPFDILDSGKGFLFVSEFEGNRITKCSYDGFIQKSFGGKGREDGKLLGPQFLASDGSEYLYVTDYGNRRVCKFDYDGNFILSFGGKTASFPGFVAPAGILVYQDKVYVSDVVRKNIAIFDQSGNYIATIGEGKFDAPEGLSLWEEGVLLVADTDKIITYNLETEVATTLSELEGGGGKVVKAEKDANGNLLTVDFDLNKLFVLSALSSMYSGLDVQIDSVFSDEFPNITLFVTVRSRLGNPITGLNGINFIVTEGRQPVGELNFLSAIDNSTASDIVILVDKSPEMQNYRDALSLFASSVTTAFMGKGNMRIVSAGKNPAIEVKTGKNRGTYIEAIINGGEYSNAWEFDSALRLAVNELIPVKNKRAVIFITQGQLGEKAFNRYSLNESVQYLKNNEIS